MQKKTIKDKEKKKFKFKISKKKIENYARIGAMYCFKSCSVNGN